MPAVLSSHTSCFATALIASAMQDARAAGNTALLGQKVQEYDSELEKYVPILMAQASIYWDMGQYSNVIKVLKQRAEFAGEHDTWKLNMAHAHFMMVRLDLQLLWRAAVASSTRACVACEACQHAIWSVSEQGPSILAGSVVACAMPSTCAPSVFMHQNRAHVIRHAAARMLPCTSTAHLLPRPRPAWLRGRTMSQSRFH